MKQKVKSIFLSDIHLGCRFCKAKELDKFLSKYETEYLFLIGDIFDGWKLKKNFYWSDDMTFVIRRILTMIKKNGTKVIYITGNHDEFLRDFPIEEIGSIYFCDEYVYEYSGRKILITHGDLFDNLCNKYGFLYHIGDRLYTAALHFNKITNTIRRKLGLKYFPISSLLKKKVKGAVNFINNFEFAASKYAKEKGCQEIMVGHIHHPQLNKEIDGVLYHNTGDFVESCSAIVQKKDELELLFN
jgi:UDP-2,3-diacylglucosamine pyrophosphatase LpxH